MPASTPQKIRRTFKTVTSVDLFKKKKIPRFYTMEFSEVHMD